MTVARAWLPLVVTLAALVARVPAQGAPPRVATVASDGGVTVEAPTGPLLVGQWFDLVVHGPFSDDAVLRGEPAGDTLLVDGDRRAAVEVDRAVFALRACALRDGELAIEGLSVSSGGVTLPVPPFRLEVGTGLDPDVVPRLAGPLGPVGLPPLTTPWGPFVWPQLLLLAAIFAYVVRSTRSVPVFVRRTPPDQLAIEALGRLRLRLPSDADGVRPFVVDVSDVLRRYVEGRFDLHAPARTTEEFLEEIARRDDAVSEREDVLEGFLTACDLVKYARARPGRDELLHLVGTAETFVEETRAADDGQEEPADEPSHDEEGNEVDLFGVLRRDARPPARGAGRNAATPRDDERTRHRRDHDDRDEQPERDDHAAVGHPEGGHAGRAEDDA